MKLELKFSNLFLKYHFLKFIKEIIFFRNFTIGEATCDTFPPDKIQFINFPLPMYWLPSIFSTCWTGIYSHTIDIGRSGIKSYIQVLKEGRFRISVNMDKWPEMVPPSLDQKSNNGSHLVENDH